MEDSDKKNHFEDTEISLRFATSADIPVLTRLEQSVAGTHIYSPMLEAQEWEEELARAKVFLIENNSGVVGNVSYEKMADGSVYISGLVIEPRFQGQGIARKTLENILKRLRGVKKVWLVTHPENVSAISLYQSLGFVVQERIENYYDDGEPRIKMILNH
ncbi:MAG: GNAT family N-acetyltransferase [Minisyncoccia bacterium]